MITDARAQTARWEYEVEGGVRERGEVGNNKYEVRGDSIKKAQRSACCSQRLELRKPRNLHFYVFLLAKPLNHAETQPHPRLEPYFEK